MWVCCYKPCFHFWPTQKHKMKVPQLVCGHSLGEITHEQVGRTWAFTQISHWASESTAALHWIYITSDSTLRRDQTSVWVIPASKSEPSSILVYSKLPDSHCSTKILHFIGIFTCDSPTYRNYFSSHQSFSFLLARLNNHCHFTSMSQPSQVSTVMK